MQLTLPDELVERLETAAKAQGKTLEQWLGDAIALSTEAGWQDLLAYGQERGRAVGFTEEQSGDVVHEWRGRTGN